MKKFNMKSSARLATALVVSSGALATGAVALSASPAHADPTTAAVAQPLVGVGSNTIQDLFDAYSGAAPTPNNVEHQPTLYYSPLNDPANSGAFPLGTGSYEQVVSYDATDPNTLAVGGSITTKLGANSFARPNGSGDGQKALSDAVDGVNWSKATGGAPAAPVQGDIDFSRSSSAPSGAAGTGLTWIDFAHDAVSYAYLANSNVTPTELSAVTNDITTANLLSAYSAAETSSTVTTVDGVVLLPASLQVGSGTEKFFFQQVGVAEATADAAAPTALQGLEENGANAFATAANSTGGFAKFISDKGLNSTTPILAIEPFSVGSWIGQANQKGLDRSASGRAAGVDLGDIDTAAGAGNKPYNGTPGSETPNTGFYGGHYGRDLYVIVPYAVLNGKSNQQNAVEQSIFGYYGTKAPGSTTGISDTTTAEGSLESATEQALLPTFGFTAPTLFPLGTEFNTVTTDGTGA